MSLVQDPIKWSGSMVSSWLRFWVFSAFFALALAYTVDVAVSSGWQVAMGGVLFLAASQLMILYALRRLYMKASGRDNVTDSFDSEKWHFVVMVGVFLATFIVLVVASKLSRGA